jgi:predicted O-methyltransferase YrrM
MHPERVVPSEDILGLKEQILSLARRSNSAQLMAPISAAMSGRTFHHDYHFLYDLRTLLGTGKKTYLEIGVYNGGSLALMMQHPYETELHGVDPLVLPDQVEFTFANLERFNIHSRQVTIHRNYSEDPELLRRLEGVAIDLLFIDGDHRGPSVVRDYELYSPLVSRGGFIVFDDYIDPVCSPEVRPSVDLIVQRMREGGGYPGKYEIIGTLPKPYRPAPGEDPWNSTFIVRKTGGAC